MGGMFGLGEMPSPTYSAPPFLKGNTIRLANARSGMALLIELLSPAHVWVPSYFCGTALQAAGERMGSVRFYEIDGNLTTSSLEWLDNVQPGDLVVVVDYFGFPCDPLLVTRVRECGAWVLEDACQALLSGEAGRFSDFVIFSPRKFLGIPDGGILHFNHKIVHENIRMEPPPHTWWFKALSASVKRRTFDLHGGDTDWFRLFQEAEDECPIGHYGMSEFSVMLLEYCFDYVTIAKKRVDNYRALLEELKDLALFQSLPPQTVPSGFPIRVKNRDQVRQVLFDHEIFPPVHWAIHGIVPEVFKDSHNLSDEIMTLPCDQRYDRHDMKRMAAIVLGELSK